MDVSIKTVGECCVCGAHHALLNREGISLYEGEMYYETYKTPDKDIGGGICFDCVRHWKSLERKLDRDVTAEEFLVASLVKMQRQYKKYGNATRCHALTHYGLQCERPGIKNIRGKWFCTACARTPYIPTATPISKPLKTVEAFADVGADLISILLGKGVECPSCGDSTEVMGEILRKERIYAETRARRKKK